MIFKAPFFMIEPALVPAWQIYFKVPIKKGVSWDREAAVSVGKCYEA